MLLKWCHHFLTTSLCCTHVVGFPPSPKAPPLPLPVCQCSLATQPYFSLIFLKLVLFKVLGNITVKSDWQQYGWKNTDFPVHIPAIFSGLVPVASIPSVHCQGVRVFLFVLTALVILLYQHIIVTIGVAVSFKISAVIWFKVSVSAGKAARELLIKNESWEFRDPAIPIIAMVYWYNVSFLKIQTLQKAWSGIEIWPVGGRVPFPGNLGEETVEKPAMWNTWCSMFYKEARNVI